MPIVARAGINERISAADSPFDKVRRRGILSSRWSEPPVGHALKNVLFVCTGNTCRSPMAEGLFRELVKDRPDYAVGSAGVAAMNGQSASQHTLDILKEKGADPGTFRSRAVTRDLVQQATHIFAMSQHHLATLENEFPEAEGKAYLVSEFAAEDMLRNQDVTDPFGGPRRYYDDTRWMLEKLLPTVLAYIEQTTKPKQQA